MLASISIRRKIILIIMSISFLSVLLTTILITAFGYYNLRINMEADLIVSSKIVGERNLATLVFDESERAAKNLQVFKANDAIIKACLYDTSGEVFAEYSRNTNEKCSKIENKETGYFDNILQTFQEVKQNGNTKGYIYVVSDLKELQKFFRQSILSAVAFSIIALIIAYFLAANLQNSISSPIMNLVGASQSILRKGDYSIRAKYELTGKKQGANELRILINSFNTMLSRIEGRDRELREKTIELANAKDVAERANSAKSEFLASMSHELRTPLNAIINFADIIRNQMFGPINTEKYIEYSDDIFTSGNHLLSIINDILDLSKAEAGMIKFQEEKVDVKKAIKDSISFISDRAKQNGIAIHLKIEEDLPTLISDTLRFKQIIINLLSNAVKFTDGGGEININVATEKRGRAKDFIFSVRDTGIGMTEDEIEEAFKNFGQIDNVMSKKYDGTGLGLPITKKMVEMQQGKISISSKPGVGTIVTVRLPEKLRLFV